MSQVKTRPALLERSQNLGLSAVETQPTTVVIMGDLPEMI